MFSCAWRASLNVECSLRRWAGEMPESTGKNSLRVGFRDPEMLRNVSFNATSSFFRVGAAAPSWGGVFRGTVDQAQS